MPPRDPPPDFAGVVRPRFRACDGIVVASSGLCRRIRAQEEKVPGRDFQGATPQGLSKLQLEGSWIVGVLLCPGDDTRAVANWATSLGPDEIDRIRFYYMPGTDLVGALAAWYGVGLPDPVTAEIEDWPTFHKTFGRDHANQVYQDARTSPGWFED